MLPRSFKLSQLVPSEKEALLEEPEFYSTRIFCYYPKLALDYTTYIAISGEEDRSTEKVESLNDIASYIDSYSQVLRRIDLDELLRKTDIIDCFTIGNREKSKYYKDNPLYLTSTFVEDLIRSGGKTKCTTFIFGEDQGLRFFIEFVAPITIEKKMLNIDSIAYKRLVDAKLRPYIKSKPNLNADTMKLSNGRAVHPVLYAALSYILKHETLPLKIGKDKTVETELWEIIISKYRVSTTDSELAYYDDGSVLKGMVWKSYQETYAVKILNFVLNLRT